MKRRGNGEGTVQKVGSHNYKAIAVVGWKDATHPIRRTKSGFRTSREAREYISVLKGEKPTERTIADYWSTIEREVSLLDSATQRKYRLAYERVQSIAHQPMHTIRIEQLNLLVSDLTINSAISVKNLLSKAYKLGMAEQVCSVNLALLMTLPKESAHKEKMPFAKGELLTLWSAWNEEKDKVLGMILLSCYTGMMTTECSHVSVNNCDREHNLIVNVGAKTEKRRTTPIIVPTLLMPILEWLCSNADEDGSLLGMTEKQYRVAFKKCLAKVGIPATHTPYDCRHTTATLLQDRLEPNALTEIMRHTDLQMTQHYKHRRTEELLKALDQALA